MKSRLKLNSDEAIKLWSTTFFYSTKKKKKLLKEGKGETSDSKRFFFNLKLNTR